MRYPRRAIFRSSCLKLTPSAKVPLFQAMLGRLPAPLRHFFPDLQVQCPAMITGGTLLSRSTPHSNSVDSTRTAIAVVISMSLRIHHLDGAHRGLASNAETKRHQPPKCIRPDSYVNNIANRLRIRLKVR